MSSSPPQKKIIYIVGCGRSGSTLLGFALGNAVRTLDLGEVIDFARFDGQPNGFGPETENYQYWDRIQQDLTSRLGPLDFVALRERQMKVDSHGRFMQLLMLGHNYRRADQATHQQYLRTLYDIIQDDERFDTFVVGSKYPTRLLNLRRAYPDDRIHVIHLVRNPIDLAKAFQNKEQGKIKSFWETMLYYFVINIFSVLASRGLGKSRFLRLHYEDFIASPESELQRIGSTFGIDTSPAIEKISKELPLDRGYIFNGNRMRMKDNVVFRKRTGNLPERKGIEKVCEGLSRLLFGNTSI